MQFHMMTLHDLRTTTATLLFSIKLCIYKICVHHNIYTIKQKIYMCDQKVLGPICFCEIHCIKIFVIMQANLGGYARKSQKRGEENRLSEFCSCRKMPLPTHPKLPFLLRLNVDMKSFLIPHILLIWLLLTSICSQNGNPIFAVHSMKAMKAS